MLKQAECFRITCIVGLKVAPEYGNGDIAEMTEWLQNHVLGLAATHYGCYVDSKVSVEHITAQQ